jgi:hypothetical protein
MTREIGKDIKKAKMQVPAEVETEPRAVRLSEQTKSPNCSSVLLWPSSQSIQGISLCRNNNTDMNSHPGNTLRKASGLMILFS